MSRRPLPDARTGIWLEALTLGLLLVFCASGGPAPASAQPLAPAARRASLAAVGDSFALDERFFCGDCSSRGAAPSVATNGDWVAAWIEVDGSRDELRFRSSALPGVSVALGSASHSLESPAPVLLPDGTLRLFSLARPRPGTVDEKGFLLFRFASSGFPSGLPLAFLTDAAAGGDNELPRAVFDPQDGSLAIAWSLSGQPIIASWTDGSALRVGPAPLGADAALGTAPAAPCSLKNKSLATAWEEPLDNPAPPADQDRRLRLRARRAGPAPGALGPRIEVYASKNPVSRRWGVSTLAPAVLCAGNEMWVAWHSEEAPAKSGFDLLAQRVNAQGKKVGAPVLLNARRDGDQLGVALAPLDGGLWIAVWEEHDLGAASVYARLFNAAGRPLGGEILVHTGPEPVRAVPLLGVRVAAGGPGRQEILVSWTDDRARARRLAFRR